MNSTSHAHRDALRDKFTIGNTQHTRWQRRPSQLQSQMRIIVAGNGMVGHRFVEACIERDLGPVTVVGEEPRPAYDRVALSSIFAGRSVDDLSLVRPGAYERAGVVARLGARVTAIDRASKYVEIEAASDRETREPLPYDRLVLATGSYPFVPPIANSSAAGCFVYRTIEDLAAIEARAMDAAHGVVVGGGLLGLEAANALRLLGLEVTVVELAPHPLAAQLDARGGKALQRRIERLGLRILCDAGATGVAIDGHSAAVGLDLKDGSRIDAEVVVFAAGIKPRDLLARTAGLEIGERGGIAIDDHCTTSDDAISAIGECASHEGRVYGLVHPGYEMAEVLADELVAHQSGRPTTRTFTGADLSAKLKLLGVDVASFGDTKPVAPHDEFLWSDPRTDSYARLLVDADGRLIGGMLVGDTSAYPLLVQMARGTLPTHPDLSALVLAQGPSGTTAGMSVVDLPDESPICSCHNVAKGKITDSIRTGEATDVRTVKATTRAGSGCGSCVPLLNELIHDELRKLGRPIKPRLCEHFDHTRQELFDLLRVHGIASFTDLIGQFGSGSGCEICKPAVASMLASSCQGHVLEGEQASLQDTNDHFLANLQRDGSYSVVPRVPGGEITPHQLIALGQVASEFDLYTKITGAQRVDLFGARVEQLPEIWRRLIAAGFESGHAYGKALRTVKSCVGSTWCRYGVQDSVGLAIRLELRYRGLRAPHKLKSAVSGCARECAEAQSKDFGVIATERGWNLYLCGNGGMRPQHAVLFAEDLDEDTLVRYLDRFLAFYIRTADRLERTASWLNKLDGGIEYLREVVIDDSLGIATELEAAMALHVATYECEWKAVVDDPLKAARFRSFVNTDQADPSLVYVTTRAQKQPVR